MRRVLLLLAFSATLLSPSPNLRATDDILTLQQPGRLTYIDLHVRNESRFFGLYEYNDSATAPFDFICKTLSCVDTGSQLNNKLGTYSRYLELARPFSSFMSLADEEILKEITTERDASLNRARYVTTNSSYAYAFLEKQNIRQFDEHRYLNFRLVDRDTAYKSVTVSIPPLVARGIAICATRLRKGREGVMHGCYLIAILSGDRPLFRTIVGVRTTPAERRASNPFVDASYQHAPISELDLDSSTPSYTLPARAVAIPDTCRRKMAEGLHDALASNPGIAFTKDRFELEIEERWFRIVGETETRVSKIRNDSWESIAADISFRPGIGDTGSRVVRLYGYFGRQPGDRREAPTQVYQEYYTRISAVWSDVSSRYCQ
ncbi:hypothetical protein HFO71_31385 [Rhizobium laguerreae]|uniref:hypothetical protein n=1 Tax=Rhizobium laguerreae TaxID=1076926 RepID=UPI001C9238D6|nr:hypothetical protein [Rhizobium laguerreae]MBY3074815.1 hypothetical protein [Rhizobium laguerreae]MBY3088869.1 hypothetical protein [Rhizobium laguerreae]MBY3129604.1 hypothetical protein [Rhizobium laguerreae]